MQLPSNQVSFMVIFIKQHVYTGDNLRKEKSVLWYQYNESVFLNTASLLFMKHNDDNLKQSIYIGLDY